MDRPRTTSCETASQFADYIRRVDVPGSKFAFDLDGRQIRDLKRRAEEEKLFIKTIDLVKGPDDSAPVVMAVTIETP